MKDRQIRSVSAASLALAEALAVVVLTALLAAGACGGNGSSLVDSAQGQWSCQYFGGDGDRSSLAVQATVTADSDTSGQVELVESSGARDVGRWRLSGSELQVDLTGFGTRYIYRGVSKDASEISVSESELPEADDPSEFEPVDVQRNDDAVTFRWRDGEQELRCRKVSD